MEKTTTDLSERYMPPATKPLVVHSSADYEVRLIDIDLGAAPAYKGLAKKYAVAHKVHNVIGMVTELLPQAIAACEGLQASLEAAQSGQFGQVALPTTPGKIN